MPSLSARFFIERPSQHAQITLFKVCSSYIFLCMVSTAKYRISENFATRHFREFCENKYTYGTIISSHIRSHRKPHCLHKVNMSCMIRTRAEYMSWCILCTSKHCTLIWVCSVRPLFSIAAMSLWKRSRACFSSPKIGSNANSKVLHYTCTCSVSTK